MAPLEIALVYLLFAVIGVVACRLLHLPAILGYLIAGVFLGQGGALVHDNEAAVASFLAGEVKFTEIVPMCRSVIDHHHFETRPSLETLLSLDRWAREEVARCCCS
jgi:hypothetical protein